MRAHHTILLLCLTILPLWNIKAAVAQPFVQAEGRSFTVCNQPFQFVGFNTRGICHYGRGDVLPYSSSSHITASLDYCTTAKARVIRVFCAYRGIGPVETGNRLQAILDACQARGIYVLVALTDHYSATQMHPQGDTGYYTLQGCCGLVMLNDSFYAGGYTSNYLPQVLYLADRFKDHPAVFAWQLGNEIRATNGGIFNAFCQDVRQQIRAVDPNHMIGIGLIDANHAGYDPLALYADFDFVSSHSYNGSGANDAWIAATLDKPYFIGEAGFDSTIYGPDRTPHVNNDMNLWFNQRGVVGYLQWGLMASNYDNGDGDWYFGVDKVLGTHDQDYIPYAQLFSDWATSFEVPAVLSVTPDTIERNVPLGGAVPPGDSFQLVLTGTTPLPYSVSTTANWFDVSPTAGQTACESVEIAITYKAAVANLGPGMHTETITVTADGATGSPRSVTVKLLITSTPGDFDGDFDVDMDDYAMLQVCHLGSQAIQDDPACQAMNLNDDPFVDAADVQLFIGCLSGANIPADPGCLPNP